MFGAPVDTLVYAWNDPDKADQVLKELSKLQRKKVINIIGAGSISRDADGDFHTHTANPDVGGSALMGLIGGGIIGLLGGPVGSAVGALVGASGASIGDHLMKVGMTKDQLSNLKSSMTPGSSAIYALVEHKWVEDVVAALAERFAIAAGEIQRASMQAEVANQLRADVHKAEIEATATPTS